MDFREVTATDTARSYAVYVEAFEWLKARGVRQWLRAVPGEIFQARQARGELFALCMEGQIAAIVTLAFEADTDWFKYLPQEKRWWIKSLAVARAHGGKQLGGKVIRECEAHIARASGTEAWLDCVDAGFLPDYYAGLGYQVIKRAYITYPSGNTFPVVLMRKSLG